MLACKGAMLTFEVRSVAVLKCLDGGDHEFGEFGLG
jgi:hypothetical protein